MWELILEILGLGDGSTAESNGEQEGNPGADPDG